MRPETANDTNEKNCYIVPFHSPVGTTTYILTWDPRALKANSHPNKNGAPSSTEGPFNLKDATGNLSNHIIRQEIKPFCPSNLEEVLSVIGQDPKRAADTHNNNNAVSAFVLVLKPITDETQGNILDNLEKVLFYNANAQTELEKTEEYKSALARFIQAQNVLKKLYDEEKEQASEEFQSASKEYESATKAKIDLAQSKEFREFSGEAIRQALTPPAAAPVNNPKPRASAGLFSISSATDQQDSSQGREEKGCSIC